MQTEDERVCGARLAQDQHSELFTDRRPSRDVYGVSRETEERENCLAQKLAQKGFRLAQITPKIAYHYRSKLLIPRKADEDFRFTNRLLYH